MSTLEVSIRFAANAHAEQMDKTGDPYILHPMRIAMRMRAARLPETYQVVAMLHDVVEDTQITLKEVTDTFGSLIYQPVEALTRRFKEDGEPAETYREYIVRCCENRIARVVKRYDVQDNMDPRRWHPDVPYKRYLWVLQYMMELADVARVKAEEALRRVEHGVIS